MKRIIAALTALTVIIGLGTSCQKELENRQETSDSGTGLKVTATIADNGTKVSYLEDGASPNPGLKPSWEANDIIIGFDDAEPSKTYAYKVVSVDEQTKKATLERITDGDKTVKGTATSDPADGTQMYMFYAPGTTPDKISGKSLTVSLASQAADVVPTLMMAQATVANGSLSLSFSNTTAIIGVKAPVMVDKNKSYTSLALSGSAGLNTEVKFDLDEETLKASYQTPGTLTKALGFTSDETTGKGPDVIYIVACPATQQDLYFKFNDTEEYFNVNNVEIEASNYYRLEGPNTAKQKFTVTVDNTIQNGTITTAPSGSVAWGETVTVTATPATGYELATLTYNDGTDHDIKATGTFTMPQKDVTVTGSFKKKDYNITADVTPISGTYSVTGGTYTIKKDGANVTTAQMDDEITIAATHNDGYIVEAITVKDASGAGVSVSNGKFTMPAKAVTVTVTFKAQSPGTTPPDYDITTW